MKKVVHFEIPADNLDRARKFYEETFGWQLSDWPMEDGSVYVGARTVEVDEQTFIPKELGAINGALVQRDEYVKTPQVTVNVPSVDEYINKIIAKGGQVVKPKQAIGDSNMGVIGYYAYVSDTEGNLLGLWEDVKKN